MVQPYAGFGLDCAEQENGMELAQEKSTPMAVTVARHVAGMAVVALANPLIYYDGNPVEAWAITLFGAIIIASILFGLLALIQPQRVKLLFPMTPIKSAWFILALMLLSNWQDYKQAAPAAEPAGQVAPATERWKSGTPVN